MTTPERTAVRDDGTAPSVPSFQPHEDDGVVWNVMGTVCVPKRVTEACFCWTVTFPEDGFMPVCTHAHDDIFLSVVSGRLDVVVDGAPRIAKPGEVVSFPRGAHHGLFNNSGKPVVILQWAIPGERMEALFRRLHNQSVGEVIEIGRSFGLTFAPPVSSAG